MYPLCWIEGTILSSLLVPKYFLFDPDTIACRKAVGESTYVVLKSIPGSIETTLRMSGTALGASALVAGKTVQLVTHTIGTLLVSAGEILAIVPNELGESLMQRSRH